MTTGAVIVSVGDELLAGRVLDTNAHWLSGVLRAEGFPIIHHATVRDDVEDIAGAIQAARLRAPVVIVGGGLGPTKDDLTREGLARALGVPLARNEAAFAFVVDLYAR